MKVTVIKDNESVIYGGKIYTFGQSFEADDAICKSLIARGYVASNEEMDEADVQTGCLDESQLQEMSYSELKSLAAQLGVDAKGKKEELIERIRSEKVAVEPEAIVEEADGDLPNTGMPE